MNRAGFGRRQRKKPFAEINVVPYIDVTLVLLIIFMVTAPIVQQAVTVDLPKTPVVSTGNTSNMPAVAPFVISITGDGLYKTSEDPNTLLADTDLKALVVAVVARSQVNSEQQFYIQGDRAAPYGKIVQLFTLLKANGVEKVSLLTQPEEGNL